MAGRYALIVANDTYDDPKLKPLRAPLHDAEELERVLRDPAIGNFEVRKALNELGHELRKSVDRFLEKRHRDDTLLLLDCCFSGAFSVDLTHRSGDAVHALEPLGGTGTAVLTASSALEYAYEGAALSGEPTPSVFTSEIVRGLATGEADRDYDRKISVGELYEYVWDRMQAAGAKQQPRIKSDLQGELIVAGSRRERPATPLPPELFALMRSDSMTLRMKAVEL